MSITITGLNRTARPMPNKAGHVVLAYFTFDMHGLGFVGWAFVRTKNGDLQAWPPLIEGLRSNSRSVVFRDLDLRAELNERVKEAYRALGGFIAEDMAA